MTIIPIRCYSCGKITGDKWEPYKNMLAEGVSAKDALDRLGLKRWCCRRILLGHVELIDKLLSYSREEKADDQCGSPAQIE
jgi:DNA-directed RNA polymerase I, II, and III subunit RPABC5